MTKPILILDQHFRRLEELFTPAAFERLTALCDVRGGRNWPMDPATIEALLPEARFFVASRPSLDAAQLARANGLQAIIEVSGAFHGGLDYTICFERQIEVLSCAPGFRASVAEMGLAMILAAGRGLVAEHEAFRQGHESWLDDREGRDFTLYGQRVGFVGYGNIARQLHDLLRPFAPDVSAYDPWLGTPPGDVVSVDLPTLFRKNRVLIVTAVPTSDNRHMVSSELINSLPQGGALIVLSRAHVIDFDAAVNAAKSGRITLASDVFPTEPVAHDSPIRHSPNVILSPHRAAAVPGGRQQIGDMIVADIEAMLNGKAQRQLLNANPNRIEQLIAAQNSIAQGGALSGT